MKRKNNERLLKIEAIFKKLFPEYKDVRVKSKNGNVDVIFIKEKNKFWRLVIPRLAIEKKSLYKLLVTEVPKRLSYRKAKNGSFSAVYLLQIAFVLDKGPQFIVGYLEDKLRELPEYPETTMTEILAETKRMESQGLEDAKISKKIVRILGVQDDTIIDLLEHLAK